MARRKAEMILELVDRASRPARKIIALQKRLGKAVEIANRMAQRSARGAQRATDLYRRAVQGLSRAQDALQRGIRRSNVLIQRQIGLMRTSTGLMGRGLAGARNAALLAGTAITAYGAAVSIAAGAMLAPARQFEKFQTILTTTEGSAAAAQEAMDWVQNFAVTTPYELDQVMDAFVKLRSYGLDPTNGLLRTLGDTSAAMGKPIIQAVEAIADAVTGENERLKEFGIKSAKVGKYYEYTYSKDGVEQTVKALASDRAAIEAALTGIFNDRFGGAMELQAKTFDGMLSNIMDQWMKFQLMIMNAGVFDFLKSRLASILDTLNKMAETGELQAWAEAIADTLMTGLEAIWGFGVGIIDTWQDVYPWLQAAADAMGGWRNLLLAVMAIPFRATIFAAAAGLVQFAAGALLAGKALTSIGFFSVGKGALLAGRAVLGLLNPLNLVKGAFVALRVAIIASGIGALAVGLAMAGVWIYNNWSGLLNFFKGFGKAFMKSLGPARPMVERTLRAFRRLADWIKQLVGPIDASADQWMAWGEAAGAAVGNVVNAIGKLIDRVRGWFGWLEPVNWGDYIGEIDWLALTGGAFALALLLKPIVWTLKLIGGPIQWVALLGKFALSSLITPIVWTAKLLPNFAPALAAFTSFRTSAAAQMTGLETDVGKATSRMNRNLARTRMGILGAGIGMWFLANQSTNNVTELPTEGRAREQAIHDMSVRAQEREKRQEASARAMPVVGHLMSFFDYAFEKVHGVPPPNASLAPPPVNYANLPDDKLAAYQKVQAASNQGTLPYENVQHLADLKENLLAEITRLQTKFDNLETGPLKALEQSKITSEIAFLQEQLTGVEAELADSVKQAMELQQNIETLTGMEALINVDRTQIQQALEQATRLAQTLANLPKGNPGTGASGDVQERASGGWFKPGWLLTGENGPELKYATRGGYVAHNQALQRMMAMSSRITSNVNGAPKWAKSAALAASVASSAALPSAAGEAGDGARFLKAGGGGSVSVSAPITLTIQGNVDQAAMPDLRAALADLKDQLLAEIEDAGRVNKRRSH